jgi:hypothetical protein
VLLAARKLSSWQAAVEVQAVAELDRRRLAAAAADPGTAGGPRAAAHTSEELAAALTLTGRAADTLLGTAEGLTRLPGVLAALAEGLIDRFRAVVFADELAPLDAGTAAALADTVVPRAGRLTTGQLRATLRRAVLAFDPEAARRRRAQARADARVQSWAEASGNAALAGRELPPAQVLAADRHLTALPARCAPRVPAGRSMSCAPRSTWRCCPADHPPTCWPRPAPARPAPTPATQTPTDRG